MIFTNTTKRYQALPKLNIFNDVVTQIYKIEFLGLIIDKNLNFKHHLSHLCLKLSRNIPLLYKVKIFVPSIVFKCIYYAHISELLQPYLVYHLTLLLIST